MTDPQPVQHRWTLLVAIALSVVVLGGLAGCSRPRWDRGGDRGWPAPSGLGMPAADQPRPSTRPGTTDLTGTPRATEAGVVNVESRRARSIGAGTGMVLTETGTVLTNNHVIEGATTVDVTIPATGRAYRATVIGAAPTEDIAVLRLTGASGLDAVVLGDSDGVRVGDQVAAMGNAGGRGGSPRVTLGRVTGLHNRIIATDRIGGNAEVLTDTIQVDADVLPGNSGGPLVNAAGEVVGIVTAASGSRAFYRTGEREGYAIPINRALAVVDQIQRAPVPAVARR